MKLLLIEDDQRLTESLMQILRDAGHETECVADGISGYELGKTGLYDLIILDGMLPGMDGLDVASKLRTDSVTTPILMLTARSATSDKVAGLDAGADDYLAKPFPPSELLARLRALGRRKGEVVFDKLHFGDVCLDINGHDLEKGEESIHLSLKEFILMRLLMESKARVVSKDSLIDKAWGSYGEGASNSLEAHISFLRKKLRFLGSDVSIEAVPKQGYRLVESGNA